MALGGVVSLTDRRYRVGAPARPRGRPAPRCRRNDRRTAALLSLALVLARRSPRLAVQPDEMLPDPAPGGAGPRDHRGTALRRLPERVDRRIERRHRPRPAPAGARARSSRATATPQVLGFVVARYGEFVLFRPPLQPGQRRALAARGGSALRRIASLAAAAPSPVRRRARQADRTRYCRIPPKRPAPATSPANCAAWSDQSESDRRIRDADIAEATCAWLVRERIVAGDSDDEVLAFVVDRYGEFVLFRPPMSARQRAAVAGRAACC